jgi:hypothetical protein
VTDPIHVPAAADELSDQEATRLTGAAIAEAAGETAAFGPNRLLGGNLPCLRIEAAWSREARGPLRQPVKISVQSY